jgi:DNA polymerase-3 subunit alpha
MDGLDRNRAALLAVLPLTMKAAEQHGEMCSGGQTDFFGELLMDVVPEKPADPVPGSQTEWTESERLAHEKATLGLYLSGHPITPYEAELRQWTPHRLGALGGEPPERSGRHNETRVSLGGLVLEIQERSLKNGNKMASALLDDRTGRMQIVLYAEVYDRFRALLKEDAVVFVEGVLGYDDFASRWRVNVEQFMLFEQAREIRLKNIELDWQVLAARMAPGAHIAQIQKCLSPFLGGRTAIQLVFSNTTATASLQLGNQWRVHPTDELIARLKRLYGAGRVQLNYSASLTGGG